MKIHKSLHSKAMMLMIDDITIYFTHFEKQPSGVNLMDGERLTGVIHFDMATEFYKALRAM